MKKNGVTIIMSKLSLVKPQGITLTLGETEYSLVYDFNAFAELEREFGDIQTAFDKMTANPKMSDILKIVKAGLISNEKSISDRELGSYLTPKNLPQVVELIGEAMAEAMPQNTQENKKSTKN